MSKQKQNIIKWFSRFTLGGFIIFSFYSLTQNAETSFSLFYGGLIGVLLLWLVGVVVISIIFDLKQPMTDKPQDYMTEEDSENEENQSS